jgi:ABC-type amino acid transport substrate-binding protein
VKFIPTTAQNRFTALQSGDVDVLIRSTTWTLSRDTSLGLNTSTTYFDGQGFIVRKSLKVTREGVADFPRRCRGFDLAPSDRGECRF